MIRRVLLNLFRRASLEPADAAPPADGLPADGAGSPEEGTTSPPARKGSTPALGNVGGGDRITALAEAVGAERAVPMSANAIASVFVGAGETIRSVTLVDGRKIDLGEDVGRLSVGLAPVSGDVINRAVNAPQTGLLALLKKASAFAPGPVAPGRYVARQIRRSEGEPLSVIFTKAGR